MIQLENVHKSYGQTKVLKGIDFRNLQLLDVQVKIQEEIGYKDRTSPNDTNDN